MRVLIAITKGEVGGAQEYVRILTGGLVADGHDVSVLVSDPSELADSARSLGASVEPWRSIVGPYRPLADLRARRELLDVVRRVRPDVVHLNSSKAGALGTGALKPPDGVTVFTCHHAPFGPGRQWRHRALARPVEQFLLPRVDGIISVGLRDVPMLRRIAPGVPLRVIANAVPTGPAPTSEGPLRPVALWVARLAHPKDPLLAIEAWAQVVAAVPEATLVMCGTGPLAAKVQAAVEASPVRDRIEFLGFVDDLAPHQARSSLFVLPTRVEGGLTMATLDAMANGLVPIVSDAGDAVLLEQLDMGRCVRGRTAADFAATVVDVLGDPIAYERMRSNALTYAREKRTPADFVSDTVAFYQDVLAGAGGGTRP